jgi:hypothetical protein
MVLSYILGILIVCAVIAAGIRLFQTNRNHIFYFSLFGTFLVSFFLMLNSFTTYMDAMLSETVDLSGEPVATAEPVTVWFDLVTFLMVTTGGLFLILFVFSVINPFIRKNKKSVRIVSALMIPICLYLAFMTIVLSNFAG